MENALEETAVLDERPELEAVFARLHQSRENLESFASELFGELDGLSGQLVERERAVRDEQQGLSEHRDQLAEERASTEALDEETLDEETLDEETLDEETLDEETRNLLDDLVRERDALQHELNVVRAESTRQDQKAAVLIDESDTSAPDATGQGGGRNALMNQYKFL